MSTKTKRRIERVRSFVTQTGVGTSASAGTIHTAEDSKTLIRVLVRGKAWVSTDSVSTRFGGGMLSIRPNAVEVADTVTVTQALDQSVPLQELLRVPVASIRDNTNNLHWIDSYEVDTKMMRKLKAGDTLVWSAVGNASSSWSFITEIYMWFKE